MKNFDDLIYTNPNALDAETCKDITTRFERDPRKKEGITTTGLNEDMKKSMDLRISDLEEWKDIDEIIFKSLAENLDQYTDKIIEIVGSPLWSNEINDNGYNIKRYTPNDYYNWHVDCQSYKDGWTRTIACIWYLNDVKEGGETEFAFGRKIIPSTGKLILFPATWNFPHRGLTPIKGDKYIITSFVVSNEGILYD